MTVSSGARVDGSILCGSVSVSRNVRIAQGCVIGEGCVIGDGASLGAQVRLSAGRVVENGQNLTDGQPVFSSGGADLLSEGGISISRTSCDATLMFRIGDAVASSAVGKPIGIMRVGGAVSLRRFSGLIAFGAAERGSDVFRFRRGLPRARVVCGGTVQYGADALP